MFQTFKLSEKLERAIAANDAEVALSLLPQLREMTRELDEAHDDDGQKAYALFLDRVDAALRNGDLEAARSIFAGSADDALRGHSEPGISSDD